MSRKRKKKAQQNYNTHDQKSEAASGDKLLSTRTVTSENANKESAAGSVIPPTSLSPTTFDFIHQGIGSLYLSLSVNWHNSTALNESLKKTRNICRGDCIFWRDSCDGNIFLYRQGMSRFPFHLKTKSFDFYLNPTSNGNDTNVYLCIKAHTLLQNNVDDILSLIHKFTFDLNGCIKKVLINRVDLYSDYNISGGLSSDFLLSHKISSTRVSSQIMNNDKLGTFYIGSRTSGLLCRVYDKTAELKRPSMMSELYKGVSPLYQDNAWRTEFEVRRNILAQFDINDTEDLKNKVDGLWQYLTRKWLSFRLPDNNNPSRRTLHRWWKSIQGCAGKFGEPIIIKRCRVGKHPNFDCTRLTSLVSGLLPRIAVLSNNIQLADALGFLCAEVAKYWLSHDFSLACSVKQIELGISEDDCGSKASETKDRE